MSRQQTTAFIGIQHDMSLRHDYKLPDKTIEAMSKQGSSVKDIAEALGTHRDTIYREFKRCGATLETYTAAAGQQAL